jgi:hypothetical protein
MNVALKFRRCSTGHLGCMVLAGVLVLGLMGCSTGSSVGGGNSNTNVCAAPPTDASLADLQGEWWYIRGEGRQTVSADCITIEGSRVTHFVESCDGDDVLSSSEDITTNGTTAELRFSIALANAEGGDPTVIQITLPVSACDDQYIGTEQFVAPESDPREFAVRMQRPTTD